MGDVNPVCFERVLTLWSQVADLHRCLQRVYPIAVAGESELEIHDIDAAGRRYRLTARVPAPVVLPKKIRAAFPLADYENKMACVVTRDVFETPEGCVDIFHGFVHCYQFYEGEQELKQTLSIARQAAAAHDYMWELNYPFPYDDPVFCERYGAFLRAVQAGDVSTVAQCRTTLAGALPPGAFEYLVWQEWKEGFARYIENKVRSRLGLAENHAGGTPPFSRVSFYAGGAGYIDLLSRRMPGCADDPKSLFDTLRQEPVWAPPKPIQEGEEAEQ